MAEHCVRCEVDQLLSRYAWLVDHDDFAHLGEVFTDDATFAVLVAGVEVMRWSGRTAIVEGIRTARTDTDRVHLMTNLLIVDDDSEAISSTSRLVALLAPPEGAAQIVNTGIYEDVIVRNAGVLRFRSRVATLR